MRIDAHHHLWRYTPEEFDWIDDRMQAIRRDFLPSDLTIELASAAVDGTVAVQARQSLQETEWLLQLAAENSAIRGVIGWAPIASADFANLLSPLSLSPLLKGLRHVVQAEPTGFLDAPAFNAGIAEITARNLVYDILITAPQLPEAIRFVDGHPNQIFVLDHIAKPDIAAHILDPWAANIRDLAKRPNVFCKVSGMVTEASWPGWTIADLQPYFDTVLDCFTPARLMAGSDWPVLEVACGYKQWWDILDTWTSSLSATEQAQIKGYVAASVYKLHAPPS